jgi:predicted ATPase
LHWADPSTLELLQLLVEQGATARLLMLYTARPEFRVPWPLRAHHTQITLNRLSSRNVRTMVGQVAAQKALTEETVAAVVERTGGVPLFVEELTRAVLDSGDAKLPGREIPATLHDSLMARLDRLGAAKEVAQVGAVIGGEFSYELLLAVYTIPEEDLQRALRSLADAELLYVRGIAPDATYQFKHALIRDAAYEALLKTRRRELHRHVATVLNQRFPELAEAHPELLARHYTEAELSALAIPYWQRAGQQAVARSAHVEAISHLKKGLELLNMLADSPERAQEELLLQTTLAHSLTATKGWADPGVGKTYARCLELSQQVGDFFQQSRAFVGLFAFYIEGPQLRTAQELGEQLVSLAQKTDDMLLFESAHLLLGFVLFFRGEITSARDHLQQGISSNASVQESSRAALYGHDPRVPCWFVMACALWVLGYPDQALKRCEETVALAHELSHPYSLAVGLYWTAMFHRLRRELQATLEPAQDLIALCIEQGFTLFLAWGTILRGSVIAEREEGQQGITDIQCGLTAHQGTGGALRQPYWLGLLAEAYGKAGNIAGALPVIAEALSVVEKTDERWYEAELYRLKGDLLLMEDASNTGNAARCFHSAISVARARSEKAWELRATTSLARLLAKQGRCDEARTMLADIYGWFTEGFDTADLIEAKTLLEELRS